MKRTRFFYILFLITCITISMQAQIPQWQDVHKVKRKETIYSIANHYGITVDELIKANPEMASPDYVLKKGTFVCIPFHSTQAIQDTATVTPQSPLPVKNDKGDMRDREIRVGVMLPLNENDGDGRRMIEYYRGVLMACDSLKQNNISVDIHAWNVTENTDINSLLNDKTAQLDLIIGPLYSKMVRPISQFAKDNDIRVLMPFSIDAPTIADNRMLFQVYQPTEEFSKATAERLIQQFRDAHPIIVDCNDSTSTKGHFTAYLRKRLEEEHIEYSLTSLATSENKFLENFTMAQNNVVILNSEHQKVMRRAISKINGMLINNPEYEITLFGYTEWMLYTRNNIENFYKLDVHIPAAFYYDANSERTKRIEQKYRWNFHADMMNSLPRFAITGFDHAYFFIRGLHMYGKHFTGAVGTVGYAPIQTPLQFERHAQGGHENKNILFIHYTNDKRVETIKF